MELAQSSANLMALLSQEAVVIDLVDKVVYSINDRFQSTFGLYAGASLEELNALFYQAPSLTTANQSVRTELTERHISSLTQISMETVTHKILKFDLRIGYVDDTRTAVYITFAHSTFNATPMELRNGYYEVISANSFSYPFYLNVKTKRIEFFGPILEQFKLPPVMDNFPAPVVAGGMILEEDLDGYLAMIARMYKGEPPTGSFRSYTPDGDILKYTVNYVVRRDEAGQPIEIIGDFINVKHQTKVDIAAGDSTQNSKNTVLVHQIKAHFFFNTLNTISALCKQDVAKADKAIQTFAAYMRSYMYLVTEEHNIPFDQELSMVKSSLEIERMRFPDSFSYTLDLRYRNFELPPLSLQPIVENALLHGLRKTGRHGQLKISTEKVDNAVRIVVTDDGRGFDTEKLASSTSIGLKNLVERVELMAGGTVTIHSQPGQGTEAIIELPLTSA